MDLGAPETLDEMWRRFYDIACLTHRLYKPYVYMSFRKSYMFPCKTENDTNRGSV
jgi:hypothetical protein